MFRRERTSTSACLRPYQQQVNPTNYSAMVDSHVGLPKWSPAWSMLTSANLISIYILKENYVKTNHSIPLINLAGCRAIMAHLVSRRSFLYPNDPGHGPASTKSCSLKLPRCIHLNENCLDWYFRWQKGPRSRVRQGVSIEFRLSREKIGRLRPDQILVRSSSDHRRYITMCPFFIRSICSKYRRLGAYIRMKAHTRIILRSIMRPKQHEETASSRHSLFFTYVLLLC